MIYDCFTFFKEFDLLEIRLHELKDVVDYFVLVEADRTHSNLSKPYYYEENKERFKEFEKRIIHIKVPNTERWFNPNDEMAIDIATRNIIATAIPYQPDDLIIINDSDQIIRASVLKDFVYTGPKKFELSYYYYYFNCKHTVAKWYGATIWKYSDIKKSIATLRFDAPQPDEIIPNAGWHFSYLGGKEAIRSKLESLAHSPWINKPEYRTDEHLDKIMNEGLDIILRTSEGPMEFVPIDNTYPQYILDNKDKFKHHIKEI
jgi:beta-1,4-mannosyl-glycoprotein beta-1,4-N-acetylglucosaminyltransferase